MAACVSSWTAGASGAAQEPTARTSAARPAAAAASTLEIEHQAPACAPEGRYARLDACFRPASELARARVHFRKAGTTEWFYVEMSVDPPCHRGVLPRPRKDAGSVEYYIAATDRRSSESRTAQHSLLVTADGRCATGRLARGADVGGVVIGSASGAAPTGFVTGGVSPLLIAGGVAVVGVAVAAVLAATGDDEPPSSAAGVWRSELRPQGARGQVVVDGSRAVLATAGSESFDTPLAPGVHRFEATLVAAPRSARDSPGTWRFDLSRLDVAAGTLRVVAGEAVESGGDAVVFRLSGRSGERVGFVFEVR